MEIVRLGKKGQVSIPRSILKRLGLEGAQVLLADSTPDGAILLRPAGVYPVELYTQARVREFLKEDRLTPQEARQLKRRLRAPS